MATIPCMKMVESGPPPKWLMSIGTFCLGLVTGILICIWSL